MTRELWVVLRSGATRACVCVPWEPESIFTEISHVAWSPYNFT